MKKYIIIILLFVILILLTVFTKKYTEENIQGYDICGNIIDLPYDSSNNIIIGYNTSTPFSRKMTNISEKKYNLDLNTQYHDTLEDIQKQEGIYNTNFVLINAIDICGNNIQMPYGPAQPPVVYNTPGSFLFGSSKYVPNYYDSVLLSNSRQ
jgi:hypothetical protein